MHIPKISVILPVYNGEKYLNESLDSVLQQEFGDYEFLISDDSSTDRSTGIVGSKKDPRIVFSENKTNQGLFKNLNMLIGKSRGEYIRLWAQDDAMKPSCLREEFEFYERHNRAGFLYCGRDLIDNSGNIIMEAPEDYTPEFISPELASQIMFYYGSITGNISTVTIKKAIFDVVGLFNETMKRAADFDMWERISRRYPIGFIRKPLIRLRSHAGQLSRARDSGIIFIREDEKIITSLMQRLPSEIISYARVYNRWHHHTQYAHHLVRSLLRMDFETALGIYREMRKIDNPFIVIGLWVLTANRRFFKKKPRFYVKKGHL